MRAPRWQCLLTNAMKAVSLGLSLHMTFFMWQSEKIIGFDRLSRSEVRILSTGLENPTFKPSVTKETYVGNIQVRPHVVT